MPTETALPSSTETRAARGTAQRAVNVVRNFSEDLAARYGLDKLYQGLRYLELTRAVEQLAITVKQLPLSDLDATIAAPGRCGRRWGEVARAPW